MLESLYKNGKKIRVVKECWLYEPISQYINYLLSKGYSKSTLRWMADLLLRFASFSKKHGAKKLSALPEMVDLLVDCYDVKTSRQDVRCVLQGFIRYMRFKGMIPQPRKPVLPFARTMSQYETFVKERHGYSEKTLGEIRSCCQKFLLYVHNAGITKLNSLNQKIVRDFVTSEGRRYSRSSITKICSWLRGFLTYLYSKHKTRVDLSAVIVTPRIYRTICKGR